MMLSHYIRGKEEGDSVSLGLWREGGTQAVFVTIAERERSAVWLGGADSGEHGVRVVEKGPFVWDGQDFRIGDEDFTATLGEAMEGLEEHFNSEELQGTPRAYPNQGLGGCAPENGGARNATQSVGTGAEPGGIEAGGRFELVRFQPDPPPDRSNLGIGRQNYRRPHRN